MESNWRFRVWDTGWANSFVELAARALPPFTHGTHFAWRRFGITGVLLAGTADMQGYVPVWSAIDFLTHFPANYAALMEPD